MSFEVGAIVGSYEIVARLGKGGMATVYKAFHAPLARHVAIKVLHPVYKDDDSFLRRFSREAQVVARLEHPHIVPVFDFAEHEGYPYLVMRYVEGETLKDRMTRGGLTKEEVLSIARAVADALTYAHGKGVLHRDIKPSNILLTEGGGVYLADFGLARISQDGESTMSQDMLMGTPQYISPEQAKGIKELDGRTDVYSFGIVLYEMVTGRVPFQADTSYAIIHSQIFDEPPSPSSINDKISPAMESVLLKVLQKMPAQRYADASDLAAAFEKAAVELPTDIAPVEVPAIPDEAPVTESEEAASSHPTASAELPPMPDLEDAPAYSQVTEQAKIRPSRKRTVLSVGLGMLAGMCLCFALILVINRNNERREALAAAAAQSQAAAETVKDSSPSGAVLTPTARSGDSSTDFPLLKEEIRSIAALESLLATNPDDNQLRSELAMAYLLDGRREDARLMVREMIGQVRLPAGYIAIAEKLLEANQMELAGMVLDEGLQKYGNDTRMQQMLLMAMIMSEAQTRQIQGYVDKLGPVSRGATQVTVEIGKAYLEYQKGNVDAAEQLLTNILSNENSPYLPDIYFLLGQLYLDRGNAELALNAFKEASAHEPDRWLTLRINKIIIDLQSN